eukprot:CAMPEP_0201545946 /NCGR_PEP_ID=MMETSP0173_2-20130828/2353_1 /ASSEMBLY_ACC=CAM_ASM_000268 /TAXON_ID=218659 /ORGANISM="Vexillifera sp., Strain DIVA3 564/2" /LENGTH=181 /DNA_ID=CAMNT_0047954497 /DNA_START=20 /DNA_END=565 /DNA_ORIENTATION=+
MSDNIQEKFYNACRYGKLETVKKLIDQVDVNTYDENTPLYAASKNNQVQVVKLLLKHPEIDVNKAHGLDEYWETPLCVASSNNHVEVVKMLLKHHKIDVNKGKDRRHSGLWWWTPLCIASKRNNVEVVKLLLKHRKIDLAMKEEGWTAEGKKLVGQCLGELSTENKSTNPSQNAAPASSGI